MTQMSYQRQIMPESDMYQISTFLSSRVISHLKHICCTISLKRDVKQNRYRINVNRPQVNLAAGL